jgi:hypothetical protein
MPIYRVHYIQHVPFEGLGYMETWIKDNGYTLSVTKMYEKYQFPYFSDFDMPDNGLDELVGGKYVQQENYIRENTRYISSCNPMMKSVPDKFVEL